MSSSDVDRVAERSPFPSGRPSGVLSPLPSVLTDEHLAEALANSPDNGATLDFTHKSLTDVGEDGAERLATVGRNESFAEESSITRIALGYNRLATLPTAFALLSRLRYLNLKNNSFSIFPDVLTLIPSLEILDISRNKIKRLPTQPGSLSNLHVLCVSRNKITRLPAYLGDFGSLNVLKVDHNPIEWPPKPIIELNTSSTDPQAMKDWILSLQKWLCENSHTRLDIKPKPSMESLTSERAAMNSSFEDVARSGISGEEDSSGGPTPHARIFSADSQLLVPPPPRPPRTGPSPRPDRPPPLSLGPLPPFDPPFRSSTPESYLPTPEESVSSTDDDHTTVPDGFKHYRNGSLTLGTRDRRPALFGKKSIPDLHTSSRPNEAVHNASYIEPVIPPVRTISLSRGKLREDFVMPSPLSHREDSSSSSEGCSRQKVQPFTTTPPSSASPTSSELPHPVPDIEHHAYFKRLSSLPANAISNNLPPSLCSLVECARSIYFSVSQVHQALSHYITYTINQKLSSVLRKVADPAYTYMLQLNGALERFDAVAKKTTPPPSLCRALVESSRDTAAVFGKAIAMLSLQLKILASKDDDRYMRSLILIFYGAAAEISHAWQTMSPHIETIKSHLSDSRRIASCKTKNHLMPPPSHNVEVALASAPVGHTPFPGFQYHIPIARSRLAAKSLGRVRTTRRHAGSFSSKDVEIGRALPDYDLPPPPPPISAPNATTLRAGPRYPVAPLSSSTSSLAPSLMAGPSSAGVPIPMSAPLPPPQILSARTASHSREASQASLTTSSSSSSPQVPVRRPTLNIPQSRTLVDNDALDSMEAAVDSAPAVWELMKEMVETMPETPDSNGDTRNSIEKAKDVTERLRINIAAVRAMDPTADRRALRDDAHVFVKTVVKLSNFIKTYGSSHEVFPDLRSKMVALTNSTQEFVMLLHVSSFSPSTTPRPYPPLVSAPAHFNGIDDKLSASLSRSLYGPKALKLVAPGIPRSAIPSQSHFNLMAPSRYPMPTSAGIPGYGNWEVMRREIIADDG